MKKLFLFLVFLLVATNGFAQEATIKEDNNIYDTKGISVKPEFPGGMGEFNKFIARNYQVPEKKGLKGKVFVQFVIEKNGSLSDIKIVKDLGYGTGEEALRVMASCPLWIPGEQNGNKVRTLYFVPIDIKSN